MKAGDTVQLTQVANSQLPWSHYESGESAPLSAEKRSTRGRRPLPLLVQSAGSRLDIHRRYKCRKRTTTGSCPMVVAASSPIRARGLRALDGRWQ